MKPCMVVPTREGTVVVRRIQLPDRPAQIWRRNFDGSWHQLEHSQGAEWEWVRRIDVPRDVLEAE